jgi:iron-sulfur cluster insertion protein
MLFAVFTESLFPFFGDADQDQVILLDDDLRMIVDSTSAIMLEGAIVELKNDFIGQQLVVNNPNAKGSCGCGTSISI